MKAKNVTGGGASRNASALPALRIEVSADDNEARVSDEALAARLGYARIENFRALVRKHEKNLKKISVLRASRGTTDPVSGGRPDWSYSLTEGQSLFLIGKAGTEDRDDIIVEIAKAFVEFRRKSFRADIYGAFTRDLLLSTPRDWGPEFSERFLTELHRVGGWRRPVGNNHSNCAHFINKFVYGHLLGSLGLTALKEANPKMDGGERAHRHHQIIKDKHLPSLRQHIDKVTMLLTNSVSLQHFSDQFTRSFPDANTQTGFLFREREG